VTDKNDLERFAENYQQEVIETSNLDDSFALRPEVFTELTLDRLADIGEVENQYVGHFGDSDSEVYGYSMEYEEGRLDLYSCVYKGRGDVQTTPAAEITRCFDKIRRFHRKALGGIYEALEESSPAFDMALAIYQNQGLVKSVRYIVFTDGNSGKTALENEDFESIPVIRQVWDLQRIFRLATSGDKFEQISIDLDDLAEPIDCLVAPSVEGASYRAYFALMPGTTLSKIYTIYGPRLLERNVRAFLQARGKVNQGIRDTIKEEPEMFLAFNNGITCTVSELTTEQEGGSVVITSMKDFQIVNGGQTTASIFTSAVRDQRDISAISVLAKIIEVGEDNVDEMVPLISQYANTQNKISGSDFASNDPFHVAIEQMSRTVWTQRSFDGSDRQSHWFYERARGQYQDAKSRILRQAGRKEFEKINPPRQKFVKTDLAKYVNTWQMMPNIVSKGAQKNFTEFDLESRKNPIEPDEKYFQELIAKAIVFKTAESIVGRWQRERGVTGYRANIVTYTIALLVMKNGNSIDLEQIWRNQKLNGSFEHAIETLSKRVREKLIEIADGRNVTEVAKKEEPWEVLRKLTLIPTIRTTKADSPDEPDEDVGVPAALPPSSYPGTGTAVDSKELVDNDEPDMWMQLSAWLRETRRLLPEQRNYIQNFARARTRGKDPPDIQRSFAVMVLKDSIREGFVYLRR